MNTLLVSSPAAAAAAGLMFYFSLKNSSCLDSQIMTSTCRATMRNLVVDLSGWAAARSSEDYARLC